MKIFVLSADIDFTPERVGKDGVIVTVFLREGKEKRNFRCINCGRIVFQYTGDTDQVFDGAKKPDEKPTIDALCHRCKIIYRVFVLE